MKEFKQAVANEVVRRCAESRIVHLKESAQAVGVTRLNAQECRDVINTVLKAVPGYRVVKYYDTEAEASRDMKSLWESAAFTDLEFDED